jgi:hypothetical protein
MPSHKRSSIRLYPIWALPFGFGSEVGIYEGIIHFDPFFSPVFSLLQSTGPQGLRSPFQLQEFTGASGHRVIWNDHAADGRGGMTRYTLSTLPNIWICTSSEVMAHRTAFVLPLEMAMVMIDPIEIWANRSRIPSDVRSIALRITCCLTMSRPLFSRFESEYNWRYW